MPYYKFTVITKDGEKKTKTVEAANPRQGWILTQFPNELKRHSSIERAMPNALVYDEAKNTIGRRYVEDADQLEGARLFHLEQSSKLLNFTVSTQTYPVYFVLLSAANVMRAYRRPKEIETSPEDFYQATQWSQLVNEVYKNTLPIIEKITQIIWAAVGLILVFALIWLIFGSE